MDQFITCQTPSWNQQCLCLLQKFTIFWRKTNTISILTSEFQFRNTKPTQLELLSSSSFINQGRSSGLKVHIVKTFNFILIILLKLGLWLRRCLNCQASNSERLEGSNYDREWRQRTTICPISCKSLHLSLVFHDVFIFPDLFRLSSSF